MANVEVSWELAQDRAFTMPTAKGVAVARPELGHSVHVEPSGLAPGPRIFLPLSRRPRGQPDRADEDGAGGRRRGGSPAICGVRLQPLRDRLLHRVPPDRRRAVRLRVPHRRLHLRRARQRRAESGARAPASGRRDLHARRLSQSLRAVQDGPRPAGRARFGAVHRDLGRSRGRQRLRRRARRERHAAGGVSAAAGCSLSGVFRNDAAARGDDSRAGRTCASIAGSSSDGCSI